MVRFVLCSAAGWNCSAGASRLVRRICLPDGSPSRAYTSHRPIAMRTPHVQGGPGRSEGLAPSRVPRRPCRQIHLIPRSPEATSRSISLRLSAQRTVLDARHTQAVLGDVVESAWRGMWWCMLNVEAAI